MKVILCILFILLIPIFGWSFIITIVQLDFSSPVTLGFFGAFVVAVIFHIIRTRKKPSFFATFEHELTHNIWALITFNKPAGFHINDDGTGEFQYYGKSNFLQMLGPYVTLTLSYLLLPIYFVLDTRFHLYFFIVLGMATGYHTISTWKETGFHQTDIQRQGKFFSMVFIILGNLFSYGLILAFLINRGEGMKEFLVQGFIQARDYLGPLVDRVL